MLIFVNNIMLNQKLLEKPTLFGGLAGSLFVLASIILYLLADKSGTVTLPKDILLQASGLIISLLVGLCAYSYSLSSKLSSKEDRIKRISFWLNEIDKCNDDISTFFHSQTYLELNELLTKEEKEEISKLLKNKATHLILSGNNVHVNPPSSREFWFYRKVISRLERKWNNIW